MPRLRQGGTRSDAYVGAARAGPEFTPGRCSTGRDQPRWQRDMSRAGEAREGPERTASRRRAAARGRQRGGDAAEGEQGHGRGFGDGLHVQVVVTGKIECAASYCAA